MIKTLYSKERDDWLNLYKRLRAGVPLFYKNTIIYPELDLLAKTCNKPTRPLANAYYELADKFLPIDKQMSHICKMVDRYIGNLFSSVSNFAEVKYFVNESIFQILLTDKYFRDLYRTAMAAVKSPDSSEQTRHKRVNSFKQTHSLIEQEFIKKIFLTSIGV